MSASFSLKRGLAQGHGRRSAASAAAAAARRCQGGCWCGWRPTRSSGSRRAWTSGSIVVSSTNGKTTTAGHDRGHPARAPAASRSTTGPAPTCTGASPPRCSSSAATRACSSSTRPGCPAWRRSCAPGCWCWATSSATSSTATASSSASPTSGPSWSRLAARGRTDVELALCADDPLIADLGPRPGAAPAPGRHLLRDRGREPGPARAAARPRREALPPLRRPVLPTSARSSATWATTPAPTATPTARRPTWPRPRSSCAGWPARASACGRPRATLEVDLPLPGLYNVYNALAAITAGLRSGRAAGRPIRAGLESMRAVFGRVETIEVAGKPVSILLIKNPAGANEVLRTLSLEAAPGRRPREGLDLWIALNDRIADGRDVSWIWDADFELLADRRRRVVCAGTRAPEMALRLKYAGWPTDRIEVADGDRAVAGRSRAAAPRAPLRPADLHRAAGAAHAALRSRPRRGVLGMSAAAPAPPPPERARRSGRTSSSAPTRPTCRCGRSSPPRPAGRCWSSAPGSGRVAAASRPSRAPR